MLIAQISNLIPIDYRAAFPQTSFPSSGPSDQFLAENGYAKVSVYKEHNRTTQKLVPSEPYYEEPWVYTVVVENKTAEEIAAEQINIKLKLIEECTNAVQAHLDAEAQTKNYANILSACSYASGTHPKYSVEGRACLEWREAVWDKCYQILAEVQSGMRPIPTVEEVIAELPVMIWPE